MVKILKTIQPKHKETLSPYIQSFVQNASTAPWHTLPQALADFPTRWPFPRGDLYHWIPLLNRFDSDLETFCTTYALNNGPQVKDFGCELLQRGGATAEQISEAGFGPEGDREVIERILHFSRILLENCGNRSIYSSSTHLSDLLNSTSLSLLAATLQIGTQLAQRYQATFRRIASSHRQTNATLLANHYNIDLDKVQQLSQPFSRTVTSTENAAPTVPNTPVTPNAKGKDKAYFSIPVAGSKTTTRTAYANDLVSLVRSGTLPDPSPKGKKAASTLSQTSPEVDWNEWGDVRITYYESQARGEEAPPSTAHNASAAPLTPTPVRRTSMLGNQHGNRAPRAPAPEEPPATPSRSSTMPAPAPAEEKATSNLKVIDVPASKVSEHSVQELLQEYLPNVPDASKYTLLTKLRVAKALSHSLDTRRQMLAVRLLAVTNLAYIYPEPSFLEKVLKQDSDEPRRLQLIYQLAELIHPPAQGDLGIPRSLQTIAVNALEGLAQHAHKYQDVCTALNTNVNHGVLLYIVRKAVAEMATDEPGDKHTENDEWHSALFALLSHVATLPRAGNELVTAGLVPILVEVLTLRTSVAEGSYPRVLNFLDAIVFNVKDAFQVLANADGLDAISNLIVHEVQSSTAVASKAEGMPADYRSPSIDYEIPYYQQQSIKWLFKFIHHMMNQAGGYGGNFDRLLRNLIDSPQLLGSLRQIISQAKIFGSSVWTNAVSILNDFINNEPTSFAIIAEAGLSKAVLEAVLGQEIVVPAPKDGAPQPESANERGSPSQTDDDSIFSVVVDQTPHPPTKQMLEAPRPGPLARGIMPSSEAIIIVPEAFGAICLNNAGMKMFLESNALQSFFEIFESPAHVKVLDNDANNLATSLGATFDELVRHHPALKTAILNAVLDMVARVSHLCKTRTEAEKLGAKLLVTKANGDVVVADRSLLSELSGEDKGKGKAVDTDADVEMTGVSTDAAEPSKVSKPVTAAEDDRENSVTPYIAAVANFLTNLFNNAGIRNLFMENGGVEAILDLAELPVLPNSPSEERSHRNMHTVIALLAEQKAHILVPSLIKRAQAAADTLTPFTQHQGSEAYFAKFIEGCKPSNDRAENILLARGTSLVEAMVTAQNLCMALRQCISSPIYSRNQASSFSSMNLADYYVRLVKSLGAILAASIKEDFKLMRLAPRHWRRAGRQSVQMFMNDAPEPLIPTIDSTEEALHSLLPEAQGTAPMATLVTDSSGAENPIHKVNQTKTLTTEEKHSPEFKNFQNLHYLLGKMPISMSIFFQVIGKGLVPKRTPDSYQRQNNVAIANAIVEAVLSQLKSVSDESSSETYTFWVMMFRTVKDILVNNARTAERPQECITIVVQAFMKAGGFNTINHMLELFDAEVRNNADKTVNFNDVDLLLRNDLATLGIKHILELYGPLVTGKNVGESFQSTTLHSRSDRDRNSPNYFSAGQFVLEVRMAILPAVQKLWESDIVEKGSKIIPNKLIDIIRNVMETDLEEGAFRNADKAIVPSKHGKKKWRVNRENLVKLQAADFEEELAVEALFRCNNSYSSALEYSKAQLSERSGGRNRFGSDDVDSVMGSDDASAHETRPSTGSISPDQGAAQGGNGANEAPNDGMPPPVFTQSPEEFAPHGSVPPNLQQMLLENMNRTLENAEAGNLFAAISGGGEQTNLPERVPNQQPSSSSPDKTLESQPEIPTVERLNAERLKIRSNLIERCLEVINAHGEFTFEIADLITTVIDKSPEQAEMRATMGGTLVVALTSFLSDDVREVGKKIASYAHLLALMLQDPQFYKASLEELKSNLGNLLEFVKLSPDHKSEESSPWVAHILLIVEILLSDDAEPRETDWKIPTSETGALEQPVLKAPELVVSTEDRATLFEAILDMLPRIGKDESLALAVMRILVILTRTRHVAVAMGEKKNIQRLFVMAKQLAGAATPRIQSPLMLILRHIVEDDETIKQIMRSQIKVFLDPSPSRSARHPDITLYLRSMSNLVVRQPELFVEVSNEMVKLVKWTTTTADQPGRQQIELQDKYKRTRRGKPEDAILPTLKPTEELSMEDVKPSTETAEGEAAEGSKAVEHKVPIVENPDGVIYFLLCELLNYRDVEDKEAAPPAPAEDKDKAAATTPETTTPSTSAAESTSTSNSDTPQIRPLIPPKPETKKKVEFKAEEHPIYIYRCFLLQCLTELLASYNRTKVEFINFKRNAPTHAATPSKPRSNVVNYLLFDLIPSGSLDHAETLTMRKKVSTSSWADSTITALLSKTGEQILDRERDNTDSDDEPDLLFVRKFVLENIIKAYREASTSTEPLDIKYSRMLSLADLMSHIMAGKDNIGGGSDPNVTIRSQQQLKRIMFEKGYIGALTASIADIDLNFPGAKRAVKHILRPLKALTQTAIELSEVGKVALTPGQHDEDEIESASSVSDVDDDREETPDLFRNSTLGMFEPDRDHESSSEGEDDDEEMYDEDGYEEEMEGYEDGPIEDDEDNISDEDEDLEGMGEIEGLDGDHGMDVEVIMDDDEDDDESGSSDEDDEDEDDDMDEDDEDDRVQIIDNEGNPHPLAELDDEEDWESEDEDEEEDYEGMAADEEEEAMHAGGHGPLGRLVHAFGGDPHHHGEIDNLLQRIEDERGGDPDMDIEYLDDDHEEDDEVDEEEEEMEDDEDMYEEYQPEPGMPFTFEWNDEQEPPMIISHRGHRAHAAPQPSPYFFGAHRDPLGVRDYYRGSYRSHRPGPTPRDNNDGTNPLLQRGDRARGDVGLAAPTPFMGRETLFNIVGRGPFGGEAGGPAAILNDLFTQLPFPGGAIPTAARNGGALHFHVTGGPGGADAREFQAMFGGMRPGMARGHERGPGAAEPGAATTFTTQLTATRWSEEARLLFGPRHPDMALRVLMGLMAVVVPAALEAEKKAIQEKKEAEEKKRKEDEEKAAQAAKEAEEKAAKEKKEAEEREAEERARAEEAAAAAAAAPPAEVQPQEAENVQPMEGVESGEAAEAGQEGEGAPAEDRPRVTIPFRDGTLDITDLGIDLDYLDALPEELREEVITGAIAQRRSDAAATGAPPSEIDQEFLNALPDEIRAEIIQQERQDRRRRERDEARRQAAANGAPAPVPQEMDAASILATLPADLRAQVLAEQDEDVLAQLPPEYIAQARASMGGHPLRGLTRVGALDGARPGRPSGEIVKPVRRSIVQMLDKPGVATLLRLMFIFQQDSLRNTLYQVLQNISENRHNRGEVISTILHILQDGSADMTAVERSFAHLSLRAKQPKDKDPKTPLSLSRKNTGTSLAALTTVPNTDISPLMVVQQCLGALIYLCKVNLHVPSFFLTEHESAVSGLKRNANRKGKGKDTKALKFPLNSLLVLLDRKLIMESSPVMESLSDLLSRITAPLQTFERKQKEAEEAAKKAEEKPAEGEGEGEGEAGPAEQQGENMDTDCPAPAATEDPPAEAGSSTADASRAEGEKADDKTKEAEKKKVRPFVPPVVPDANLKLVINIFVARECSAKTFRETLSTIKNLSCLPGAKAVFGKELIAKAQELGEVILLDLEELFPQIQKASNSTELQGVALTKFSPSGSDQNKLLRVLTALDHLFDPKHARKDTTTEAEAGSETADTEKQDLLATLYENSTFGPMWEKLSACLSAIRQRDHMLNVATILLPLIESLMVVCKNTTLKDQPLRGKDNMLTSPVPESRMESLFFTFTEEHRKILNDLVRNTPKLMSGTFSLLVKNPKVLEFDNKRNYFNRSIHNRNNPARQSYPSLQLSVRRDQVFHDSFKSLYFKSGDEMKFGKLSIRFHGEEGVDAGGVTREWFQVLSRQMFDPGYALFIPVSSDRTTFHPNLTSSINPEHLMFFKFIGRVIGKALYEGRVLDCHFSRAVYKRILGKAVSVKDMESLDPEYYKSVVWMLENDITDIISESFSVDNDKFGVVETVDLIENGRNVPVTEENKHEYVRLMVEFKLTGSVQEQLDNFLKGFHEIIPAELVAIFNEQELELLISGLPEIDVDDWKATTEYHNYTASSPQIQWFWRAIRSFDKEERAKMLQFVTGTSKVPLNGFKELEGMNGFSRFNIHRDYGNKDRLPTSHTCFNQLDLPEYESYEMLRQQVLTAITTGSEYFGFA
ncbi:hypothetical protein VE00_00448 [Pseudogymnoascus sp. WSF 3629]|nr:hypothetical protein VE00_00448 [Pseudogymnoascus sp. WSF 3629]